MKKGGIVERSSFVQDGKQIVFVGFWKSADSVP